MVNGKCVTGFAKVRINAMNEMMENMLKAVIPNFTGITSSDTLVEKLHDFLKSASPSDSISQAAGFCLSFVLGQLYFQHELHQLTCKIVRL